MRFSPFATLPCGLFDRMIAINLIAKYWARVAIRRPLHSSSSSDTKLTPSRCRGCDANDNILFPSRPFSFSTTSMSQESELMKSEMQIMTAQLGSTAAADESPQSDKGEKNDTIFIFTRVPLRDKQIYTSSAKKRPAICLSHVDTLHCDQGANAWKRERIFFSV